MGIVTLPFIVYDSVTTVTLEQLCWFSNVAAWRNSQTYFALKTLQLVLSWESIVLGIKRHKICIIFKLIWTKHVHHAFYDCSFNYLALHKYFEIFVRLSYLWFKNCVKPRVTDDYYIFCLVGLADPVQSCQSLTLLLYTVVLEMVMYRAIYSR